MQPAKPRKTPGNRRKQTIPAQRKRRGTRTRTHAPIRNTRHRGRLTERRSASPPHHAPSATSSRDRRSDTPPTRAATLTPARRQAHSTPQKKERHPHPTQKRGGAALNGETPSLTVTTCAETPPRAHAHHPSTRRHPPAIAQQRGSQRATHPDTRPATHPNRGRSTRTPQTPDSGPRR